MMKKLLCLMLAACMLFTLAACGGSGKEDAEKEAPAEQEEQAAEEAEVPKSEQEGSAGSNIPLKDNAEEAEKQIIAAMQDLIKETYGDKVTDSKISVEKIYTAEDEQENEALKAYNLSPDEVAFEVKYELKPAEGADVNEFTAATGEYDEASGWVKEKFNLGVLRPNGDGTYKITDFGTGW